MLAIQGGASSEIVAVGWVRPFCRTALQPARKAASSSGANFGVDPFLGAGRTLSEHDGPGHWADRDDGRGVWSVLSDLTGPSEAPGAPG